MLETEVKTVEGVKTGEVKTDTQTAGKVDARKPTEAGDLDPLLKLLMKRLKRLIRDAGLTLEDVEALQETADRVKELNEKIEKLERQIKALQEQVDEEREKVKGILDELNENEALRQTLEALGIIDRETLNVILKGYGKRARCRIPTKYVVFKGERFNSVSAFLRALADRGLIELPSSKYNPKRYLEAWVKKHGFSIKETATEITIITPDEIDAEEEKPTEEKKA